MTGELDGLTAIDRLRLYATDPDTFSFDIDDAIAAVEKYEEVERRADLVEQMAADLSEGFEILGNLIDSIQRHGNYSPESTITFVDQARQCVRAAILKARQTAAQPANQAEAR
jgi:hypothetical protein